MQQDDELELMKVFHWHATAGFLFQLHSTNAHWKLCCSSERWFNYDPALVVLSLVQEASSHTFVLKTATNRYSCSSCKSRIWNFSVSLFVCLCFFFLLRSSSIFVQAFLWVPRTPFTRRSPKVWVCYYIGHLGRKPCHLKAARYLISV